MSHYPHAAVAASLLMMAAGLSIGAANAQTLPSVAGAGLEADVRAEGELFTYTYQVRNPSANQGSVWVLAIDISIPPGGAPIRGDGLHNSSSYLVNTSRTVLAQPVTIPMIPVGVESPPKWLASLTVSGNVVWGAGDESHLVAPGASRGGFQMTSRGLPAVRAYKLMPHLDYYTLPITHPRTPDDLERYKSDVAAIENSVAAKGMTVGPIAPPAEFKPVEFVKTIQGYIVQARQQGWIRRKEVAERLNSRLHVVLESLWRGETLAAKQGLKSFSADVESQKGTALSPEAVALLGLNAQYLSKRIP